MNFDIKGWLKQPTTIHGIAGAVGLSAGYVAYYATRSPEIAIAAGGYAANAVCMAMSDNSADKSSIEKLVTDGINAVVAKNVSAMLPTLGDDMRHVLAPVMQVPLARNVGQGSNQAQQTAEHVAWQSGAQTAPKPAT